jgi:N-acetylglutamate synthase-like GNAT family acetyltransferase
VKITKREITKEEHQMMLDDFRKIEIEHGVPDANTRRLNVTVEDESGAVIGFASGLTNRKWLNLTDLWVHEDYRKQGLGAKILKMLEDDALAIGMEYIHTMTAGFDSNDLFYQKQGYEIVATHENFFGVERGHHFVLRKKL